MGLSTQYTVVGNDAKGHGYQHGTDTNRIDIVEVGALKFYMGWTQAQWFIDHQIRDHGANPGEGNNAKYAQSFYQCAIDAHFHQDNRHHHIKHNPDHTSRMGVGETGEEV